MSYRLICSDIDGTLLNKNRELSKKTIEQVQRIAPVPFVLLSSRMPKAMRHLQNEFGNTTTPLIAYNGGLVIGNNKILHSTCIDNKVLEVIINQCSETTIHLSLYFNDEWYVPSMDYWAKREANNTKVVPLVKSNRKVLSEWEEEGKGAHKIMCMGDEVEIDRLYKALEENYPNEIMLYRSKPTYIEISHKSISKKTAIEVLLKECYPAISMNDVVAFGDNYNDIEMLKSVGLGVAVSNANLEVLAIADKVTDTNRNDGVAKILEELF
ncbi:MAG: haloacid dehalogenase [Lutibacter sp.]|nr:MAG: haloacid dehalogenase [Lutibacter sp.]